MPYIDPRVRIAAIALYSWAHIAPSPVQLMILLAASTSIAIAYHAQVAKYKLVLFSTALLLAVTGSAAAFLLGFGEVASIVKDTMRFFSLVLVTLALVVSMNSLELMQALVWFRLPTKLAVALGIAFRFVPVFAQSAARLWWLHRQRLSASAKPATASAVSRILSIIPLLFVDVLRRLEGVLIAITIQDVEFRIRNYRPRKASKSAVVVAVLMLAVPALIVLWPLAGTRVLELARLTTSSWFGAP